MEISSDNDWTGTDPANGREVNIINFNSYFKKWVVDPKDPTIRPVHPVNPDPMVETFNYNAGNIKSFVHV